ncbi:hypothetical protein GZL_07712 [Streptomyces sp. 769]|nr:hypothetical protein GZL_07712 [Streptomyces sp. 769]
MNRHGFQIVQGELPLAVGEPVDRQGWSSAGAGLCRPAEIGIRSQRKGGRRRVHKHDLGPFLLQSRRVRTDVAVLGVRRAVPLCRERCAAR